MDQQDSVFQKTPSEIELAHSSFQVFIKYYFVVVTMIFLSSLFFCYTSEKEFSGVSDKTAAIIGLLTVPMGFLESIK